MKIIILIISYNLLLFLNCFIFFNLFIIIIFFFLKKKKKLDLYAPSRFVKTRRFILEGPLSKAKSGRKLHVYLFNDLLLFTQLKSNSARTMTKGAKYWVYRRVNFYI